MANYSRTLTEQDIRNGVLFPDELMIQIRDQIAMCGEDQCGKRIYFENAGGAPTLKKVCEVAAWASEIPDFPNRPTPGAQPLQKMVTEGIADAKLTFGAKSGAILCDLTVSKSIFTMTGVIMNAVPGTNVVTSNLEHPATYDACRFFGGIMNKEVRVAQIDKKTGAIDIDDLLSKIDLNTCLLSLIHASNVIGTVNDIETIVREARKIKPDLYILLDCTQHIPHGTIDVEALNIDAAGFAPYKILGKRGLGIGWLSERASLLPHPHFLDGAVNDWDLGNYEPAGMAALTMVNDYICWIGSQFIDSDDRRTLFVAGMEAIELHERALMYRMLNGTSDAPGVKDIPGVKLYFMDDLTRRDAILPMTFDTLDAVSAMKKYIANGIYLYNRALSNKMSRRVLDSAGIPSIVRVAPLHFNTKEEIDRFLHITMQIAKGEL